MHTDLPIKAGEVAWAARMEMARTVEDVLSRRTRCLLLDAKASLEAAPRVASILSEEIGFDDPWIEGQVRRFRELAEGYLLP